MVIEHPLSRAKGKSGLFWVANRAECPVKIMDGGNVAMIFLNGYVFARAVGMKEIHGNPMPSFIEEGAQIIVRASEFKKTETIIELCSAEDAPVVIRKYGYEYSIALAPKVYEQYRYLFESDNLEEDKL